MPRRVQDIVPNERRSIRDIPIERVQNSRSRSEEDDASNSDSKDSSHIKIHRIDQDSPRHMPVTPPPRSRRSERPENRLKWLLIALGTIIIVGGVAFAASSQYSRATFRITPKTLSFSVNGTYVAQAASASGALTYKVVTVRRTASTTVPASDGANISSKAQGSVTLYNAYSAQPVRLIAGTRLADDSGRIYRLTGSVSIPGYTKKSASVIPGTLKTTVVADQPGQKYNIGKTDSISDFKIVAYQGTPRYSSIYGRIASDMTGGASGVKKTVSPAILASTTNALKSQMDQALRSELANSIPAGYIMYPSAIVSSFKEPLVSGSEPGLADVSVSGSLSGIVFEKNELVSKISGNKSDGAFGRFGYEARGLNDMDVNITNLRDFSPEKKGSVIIKAKGDISLVGAVPVEEIRGKLYGLPLTATQELFATYSDVIKTGSGELVPPWSKIPSDPDRVTVQIED